LGVTLCTSVAYRTVAAVDSCFFCIISSVGKGDRLTECKTFQMQRVFAASFVGYVQTACMFAKMLNAVLFARQNPIYAVVYVLACFCELTSLPVKLIF